MKRLFLFSLFTILIGAILMNSSLLIAMEQSADIGLGKEAKSNSLVLSDAKITDLSPDNLREIFKHAIRQRASIKERRQLWHTLILCCKDFNEALKKIKVLDRMWLIVDTPVKYREKDERKIISQVNRLTEPNAYDSLEKIKMPPPLAEYYLRMAAKFYACTIPIWLMLGANVNSRDAKNMTALSDAALAINISAVVQLCAVGSNPDNGKPLHKAALNKTAKDDAVVKVLKTLFKFGALMDSDALKSLEITDYLKTRTKTFNFLRMKQLEREIRNTNFNIQEHQKNIIDEYRQQRINNLQGRLQTLQQEYDQRTATIVADKLARKQKRRNLERLNQNK